MKLLKSIIAFFFLTSVAQAGEVMQAGTVLTEDSYVFTIDEAQQLRKRMEELENKESQLDVLKTLDEVNKQKITLYEETISLKNLEISEYKKILTSNDEYIDKLNKRVKNSKSMNYIAFGGGFSLALFSIIIADKIDDNIIDNQSTFLDTSTGYIEPTAKVSFKF